MHLLQGDTRKAAAKAVGRTEEGGGLQVPPGTCMCLYVHIHMCVCVCPRMCGRGVSCFPGPHLWQQQPLSLPLSLTPLHSRVTAHDLGSVCGGLPNSLA